jgi:glutamine amidotransferase
MRIGVIDYGMGNLRSVLTGLRRISVEGFIISHPEEMKNYDRIILPGVGAFGDAMRNLRNRGFEDGIKEFVRKGKPFLGICLGFQLLFEESEESKGIKGLGFFKGCVKRFPEIPGIRIPHVGWNTVNLKKSSVLFEGIRNPAFFYFVHSYYVVPQDEEVILGETDYFIKFCSAIEAGNIVGTQFHPEKSQIYGLKFLHNFSFSFKQVI